MQQVDVGPHYNFQSGSQAWHLTADAAGLIFIGITAQTYPAEDLQAQAGMFKTRAKVLRSKVWWKLCKMRLLIAFIIVGVTPAPSVAAFAPTRAARALIAVIVPLALKYGGSDDDDDKK
ncbi:hypothetical protein SO694_00019214 [Aureococcus anophagefferens]|uniref:V-SNARE coiled-coil homology domain-containing protein n=1 Tax=Aureococcus anophagefferens TaxID=44056 RepID=A0ABR1G088_AURAN